MIDAAGAPVKALAAFRTEVSDRLLTATPPAIFE